MRFEGIVKRGAKGWVLRGSPPQVEILSCRLTQTDWEALKLGVDRAFGGDKPLTGSALIDTDEASELLGITRLALFARIARGQVPPNCVVRTGRRIQLHRQRLIAFLNRGAP